ncbi:MAG: hypothetical protein GY805_03230 [Chloroflexi bacterium]|nr:hypothetical protein [Chloroflexota bacterium]
MSTRQYMLASYQVKLDDQKAFLEELIATEQAYREESLITNNPIIRMASKKNPEFILEIIEFIDSQAVADVMENANVQAHWVNLAGMWEKGDFAADEIPEAHIPWALMDAIHP